MIGADDAHADEKPRHVIDVSTFYVDTREVTNEEYKACSTALACPEAPPAYPDFQRPHQPAVPIQWAMAAAYCRFAGKRLPTEAEWEKVARGGEEGRTYPWGDDAPTCEKAHYKGCAPNATLDVGSLPAGAYGVFDMAGNGYEWVQDWASDCYDGCKHACGASCSGLDPMGPCDGAPSCEGHHRRVLKGGSWYWPADETRGAWRRAEMPNSEVHRLSFRCAASFPDLFLWPPRAITDPPKKQADPTPPSAEQARVFADVVEDANVMRIKTCEDKTLIAVDCRDATSYTSTNEDAQEVWLPFIENVGGAYVGVGADQSYSLIAAARSEWAWIVDYDPSVVRVHAMLRALVLGADSPRALVDAFDKDHAESSRAAIEASIDDAEERKTTGQLFADIRPVMHGLLEKAMKPKSVAFGWLRVAEHYDYVRLLMKQGRIRVLRGNLLEDGAMQSVAKAARALGVVVRVYYPSNAEEMWKLPPQYRANVRALPFDERSVVLRTVSGTQFKGKTYSYWHYVVHGGLHAQWMLGKQTCDHVWCFMKDRRPTGVDNSSAIGLFADTPR